MILDSEKNSIEYRYDPENDYHTVTAVEMRLLRINVEIVQYLHTLEARVAELETTAHAAAALGKIGGASRSEAKQAASRINGTKGGRPKKS